MNLADLDLHYVKIPMRTRFRRVSAREAVLIRGPHGWGEFSPFPDYGPDVTCRWLAGALEAACQPGPAHKRDAIEVNVTIPAVEPDEAVAMVLASGCSTAKVKIAEPGQPFEADIGRVAAVRDVMGETGRIRVDANAAWTLDEATDRIAELASFDLEYVEQPVSTIAEMAALRKRVSVPLAADELIRQSADPLAVVEAGAADILVLKVQPLGGASRTLDIARRAGIPVVVSSALETSVGLAAGIDVAAALDDLRFACGLGTGMLLTGDVTSEPLRPREGKIEVRPIEPEPELLERWKADRDTELLMSSRLQAAAELVT